MARPIKSSKVQRLFKYMGLMAGMVTIMAIHVSLQPPEKYRKRSFRQLVETNKFIWTDRGINPHAFGEIKTDGPFSPPTEH